jgi:hypothetical protein
VIHKAAPLNSDAAGLLLRLTAAGLDFRRDGDRLFCRPVGRVPANLRAPLHAAKPELLTLLDDGVQQRRAAFETQLAAAPSTRVPAFIFRVGTPYQEGICFSCGDGLPVPRFGRCWRCSFAWRLATRVSTIDPTSFDEARVI